MDEDERDLLIRIDTKLDDLKLSFKEHADKDERKFDTISKEVKTAHRRLDFIIISGILTIILFIAGFLTTNAIGR